MKAAGKENLGRQKAALRREQTAMDALRKLGLHGATIDRLHLGLKQPYIPRGGEREVRNALSYPLLSERGEALGRYAYLNLPDVTRKSSAPSCVGSRILLGISARFAIRHCGGCSGHPGSLAGLADLFVSGH